MSSNLSMDDRHSAFIAGMEYGDGEGFRRGRAQAEADMARLHALAYRAVQGAARGQPHAEHWAGVAARQVASCEAQKQAAVPWPDENPNPSARVLNGWPDP